MPFGVSFMPQGGNGGYGEQTGSPIEPTQQAIKILSLRLPKVTGGSAFAPQQLLQAPGGGGNPMLRSGIAQTQGRLLPMPTAAPPMGMPSTPMERFGAGGGGGLSPAMLQQVMQILAGPRSAPPQPHFIPGDKGWNPEPKVPQRTPPAGSQVPPPLRNPEPIEPEVMPGAPDAMPWSPPQRIRRGGYQ